MDRVVERVQAVLKEGIPGLEEITVQVEGSRMGAGVGTSTRGLGQYGGGRMAWRP